MLIDEVQNYPCLYDTSLDTYHNVVVKGKAWAKIATEFPDCTAKMVKDQWSYLKDQYNRERTKQVKEEPTGTDAEESQRVNRTPWLFYEQMRFIDAFKKPAKRESNLTKPQPSSKATPKGKKTMESPAKALRKDWSKINQVLAKGHVSPSTSDSEGGDIDDDNRETQEIEDNGDLTQFPQDQFDEPNSEDENSSDNTERVTDASNAGSSPTKDVQVKTPQSNKRVTQKRKISFASTLIDDEDDRPSGSEEMEREKSNLSSKDSPSSSDVDFKSPSSRPPPRRAGKRKPAPDEVEAQVKDMGKKLEAILELRPGANKKVRVFTELQLEWAEHGRSFGLRVASDIQDEETRDEMRLAMESLFMEYKKKSKNKCSQAVAL